MSEWAQYLKSADDITIKRLNGNSNACFKVSIEEGLAPQIITNRSLLYRRYEQKIIDKQIEQAIFIAMSDEGTGPKCFHQNDKYRIEEFFEGRPLTLWEMRNPVISDAFAKKICDFNFSPSAQAGVQKIEPLNPENLFIHQVINEWAPNLEAKIGKMKEMLAASDDVEHQ